jgi:hypothetical protein
MHLTAWKGYSQKLNFRFTAFYEVRLWIPQATATSQTPLAP